MDYSLADLKAVTNDGNGMGGNDWWWILILFLFGGNGFGLGGNAGQALTQAELQRGFDTNTIVNKLDGISNGICSLGYDLNSSLMSGFNAQNVTTLQGFNGLGTAVMQGFNSVDNAICQLGYAQQACC